MIKITLPSPLTTVLGVIAGVLSGLLGSQVLDVFGVHVDLQLSIALAAIGSIAGPITGAAFRSVIHFPATWMPAAVALASGLGIVAAQIVNVRVQGAVEGILTFLSWLLFGPGGPTTIGRQS